MVIFEGYPHTTSVFLNGSPFFVNYSGGNYNVVNESDIDPTTATWFTNFSELNSDGLYQLDYTESIILRYLDYHPTIKPIPDLYYVDSFAKGCRGIYLKWFNNQGGYSYWLFSNVFIEDKIYKSLGEIQRHWRARGQRSDNTYDLGRSSKFEMNLFGKIPSVYMREVASLLDSPEVYIYTDDSNDCLTYTDNLCGWARIQIKDGTKEIKNSKYNYTNLYVTAQFPDRFVQTLV